MVNNVHIIDGSYLPKIPGANKASKDKYQQAAVRYGMQETENNTPAATRGIITLGDFNMDSNCAHQTLIYPGGPSPRATAP